MDFDRRKKATSRIGLAPMIDVVFLLLIFFLLTSEFVSRRALALHLPTSSSTVVAQRAPIVVSIGSDEAVSLEGRQIELGALEGALKQLLRGRGDTRVRLEAAAELSVEKLVDALDAVRQAGGRRVELGARARARER